MSVKIQMLARDFWPFLNPEQTNFQKIYKPQALTDFVDKRALLAYLVKSVLTKYLICNDVIAFFFE